MGTYHSKPQDVRSGKIGRQLEDQDTTYESYLQQLEPDETLWLGTTNGSWDLVILLDTKNEFDHVCTHRDGKGAYVFYAIDAADRY